MTEATQEGEGAGEDGGKRSLVTMERIWKLTMHSTFPLSQGYRTRLPPQAVGDWSTKGSIQEEG